MSDVKQKILNFLSQFNECVIATIGKEGNPEAATVGFSEKPDLELMVGTSNKTRKYQNIVHNPRVAVVVGFQGDITVQFEGTARVLKGDELAQRKKIHFQKVPEARVFENDADQVYFSIAPNWIRYTDFTKNPAVEELRDFA